MQVSLLKWLALLYKTNPSLLTPPRCHIPDEIIFTHSFVFEQKTDKDDEKS